MRSHLDNDCLIRIKLNNYAPNHFDVSELQEITKKALASDPKTPKEILYCLAKDKNTEIRRIVASNPNTDSETLLGLAKEKEANIHLAVSQNPSVNENILQQWAKNEDESIRLLVAHHPLASPEILNYLAKDENANVRYAVPVYIRQQIAENPNTSKKVLKLLAKDQESKVRQAAITNPNTPIDLLGNRKITLSKDYPNIHGWSDGGHWNRVRDLQQRTAGILGKSVVFQDRLKDGSLGPKMVIIPAGCYQMGSPEYEAGRLDNEGPIHWVYLSTFAIGQYEVTFDEWEACLQAKGCQRRPSHQGWGKGSRPVINISWEDAQAYVRWLSEKTGQIYRLPTEAEWEYAARAGTSTPFYTGNCIHTDQANYYGKSDYNDCGAKTGVYLNKTQPVGSYPSNPFQLYDMIGNVWEWTEDCWHNNYNHAPEDGSAWKGGNCAQRIVRGGSWNNYPGNLRSAIRNSYSTASLYHKIGLRVVREL